jgi:hypothetical protein
MPAAASWTESAQYGTPTGSPPDESLARDRDAELGWLGDDRAVEVASGLQQRPRAGAAGLLIADGGDDHISIEATHRRGGQHGGGESGLHVVGPGRRGSGVAAGASPEPCAAATQDQIKLTRSSLRMVPVASATA